MALFLQEFGAPAIQPKESSDIQLEGQLINLFFLVGIFLVLVVYIGFYAYVYKSDDCVRRPYNQNGIYPCGRRHWFQPFTNLNADPDDLESTEWLGDWASDCSLESNISADDES